MDWRLSMRISPRRRNEELTEDDNLRSLLVHRLRDGDKAVMRVPLSRSLDGGGKASILCEPCNRWVTTNGDGNLFECDCGRVYQMEFAVFALVEDEVS
jgi:hypothetical protein